MIQMTMWRRAYNIHALINAYLQILADVCPAVEIMASSLPALSFIFEHKISIHSKILFL